MPRPSTRARFRFILVAALSTVVSTFAARAADPVNYFPDGTMVVVSFNAQQFLQAPLIRDANGLKQPTQDAVRALEGFGVDPTKDVDRVLLAIGDQLRAGSMLALLQGRFDADKVQKRMKDRAKERKDDINVIEEGGAAIFQCRLPPPPPNARVALPERFYLTVLDGSTIAVGIDHAAVAEALTKRPGGRKAEVRQRVADLVGRIDSKETLSFVFVPPSNLLAGGVMSGLTTMTGGVTVGDGIKTDIRIDAKDADAAKVIGDNVRDGVAKVRDILPGLVILQLGMDGKTRDAIRDMLDTFKVTARPDGVDIRGDISKDLIEKLGRK